MKLLFVAATPFEVAPLLQYLQTEFEQQGGVFVKDDLHCQLLITGVGLTQTAFQLGRQFQIALPDLAINIGIAGAFDRNLKLGDTVHVIEERFADQGVEEADGSFQDLHEMGLIEKNAFPFENGRLKNNKSGDFSFLPSVKSIGVNKVHGSQESIESISRKYQPQIESMEGAAFFYACKMCRLNFLEIRSISNYVEPRNKNNWNIPLAIQNLNNTSIQVLESLLS